MDENQTFDQDRIIKINIEEEMKKSYIDYSMSVIVARALPDEADDRLLRQLGKTEVGTCVVYGGGQVCARVEQGSVQVEERRRRVRRRAGGLLLRFHRACLHVACSIPRIAALLNSDGALAIAVAGSGWKWYNTGQWETR